LSAGVDGADVKNCRDARPRGSLSGTKGAICECANTWLAHAHTDAEIHSEEEKEEGEEEEGLFQANTVNEVDAEEEEVEAFKATAMNEEEEECMDDSYRQHDVWV
jgi:hypothetical protein